MALRRNCAKIVPCAITPTVMAEDLLFNSLNAVKKETLRIYKSVRFCTGRLLQREQMP